MKQKKGHSNNNIVLAKLGSVVPAPTQAPQEYASREVRPERVQQGPQRQRSSLPLLATAPPRPRRIPPALHFSLASDGSFRSRNCISDKKLGICRGKATTPAYPDPISPQNGGSR